MTEAATTGLRHVRLLVNDAGDFPVFSDEEVTGFLEMESGSVKRAAAQILDTVADDEALTSKVVRDHELSTDGAKVADSLRKRATALRAQADREDADAEPGWVQVFDPLATGPRGPELTGWQ